MTDFNKPETRTFEPRFQGSIEPSSLLLYDYWMILLKHWRLIVGLTIAIITLNGIRVYHQKLVYYARAAIEVQPERLALGQQSSKPYFDPQSFVNTQMEVAQSRAMSEAVIRKIGLERAAQLAGFIKTPADLKTGRETVSGALLQRVRANVLEGTFIIYIGIESTSPQAASELANVWAGTLIDFNNESEVLSNITASAAITKQVDRLKTSIMEKEKQLASMSGSAPIQVLDPQMDLTEQKLTSLNFQLIQVQNEIAEKQAAVRRLESTAPQSLAEVLGSATIAPLYQACNSAEQEYADKSKIFKPGFPGLVQLQSKRDEACSKFRKESQAYYESLVQQAKDSLQSTLGRSASLQQALRKMKPATSELSPKSSAYFNLKSDVENERKLLQELMQERQTAQLSTGGIQMNSIMRIIDRASTPKASVRPKRVQSMMLASMLGILCSTGLAFLIHFMNVRVHTHEDIERLTQFRFLTFIPELQKKDGERINRNAFQFLSKIIATREINGREPKVIIVTSVEPGEGKSFVASNLAIAEAYRGKKVMIMDIDIQRPNVHHVFKVSRSPGLPELLKQMPDSNFEVYSKLYKHLTVVPCGQASDHLPMLLDDGRFGEVLKRARSQFDIIILDAGPVLITPETLGAARYADGVLLVLRCSRTPIRGLRMAEQLLKDTNVPVIGVVLNRVQVSDRSSYYYYFRSYYSYGQEQNSAQQGS